jgi:hypothetical protein
MSSHPKWSMDISIRLINGTKGQVQVSCDECLTYREMKQQVLRALSMAEQLNAALPVESERQPFKVVG